MTWAGGDGPPAPARLTPDGGCHALRHSAAAIMLASGDPLEVISKTLGHSGYAITADIYAKVGDTLKRQAADDMNRALTGA